MGSIEILTIVCIVLVVLVLAIIKRLFFPSMGSQPMPMAPLSPQEKASDMELVTDAIHTAIMKTLYYYLTKDINFSEKSPIKMLLRGKYRDLITFLLRNDVFIEDIDENGETVTRTLFYYFINKVYLIYISETSAHVKSLLFKYFSGYSIDEYHQKKKGPPSALGFIVDYTNTFLWMRFDENERIQEEIYSLSQQTNSPSVADDLRDKLNNYDAECLRKITLNTYNIYDKGLMFEKKRLSTRDSQTIPTQEVKNEFSTNFNE